MKKILLSSVALLGLATGAMGADLPSRRAPAPVVAAVPLFTWTGFYVGVNAGYGWNTNDDDVVINGTAFEVDDEGGFVGGAQASSTRSSTSSWLPPGRTTCRKASRPTSTAR